MNGQNGDKGTERQRSASEQQPSTRETAAAHGSIGGFGGRRQARLGRWLGRLRGVHESLNQARGNSQIVQCSGHAAVKILGANEFIRHRGIALDGTGQFRQLWQSQIAVAGTAGVELLAELMAEAHDS